MEVIETSSQVVKTLTLQLAVHAKYGASANHLDAPYQFSSGLRKKDFIVLDQTMLLKSPFGNATNSCGNYVYKFF